MSTPSPVPGTSGGKDDFVNALAGRLAVVCRYGADPVTLHERFGDVVRMVAGGTHLSPTPSGLPRTPAQEAYDRAIIAADFVRDAAHHMGHPDGTALCLLLKIPPPGQIPSQVARTRITEAERQAGLEKRRVVVARLYGVQPDTIRRPYQRRLLLTLAMALYKDKQIRERTVPPRWLAAVPPPPPPGAYRPTGWTPPDNAAQPPPHPDDAPIPCLSDLPPDPGTPT